MAKITIKDSEISSSANIHFSGSVSGPSANFSSMTGISNINATGITGSFEGPLSNDNSVLIPDDGYYNGSGTISGSIRIRLPVDWNNSMFRMIVNVYDYAIGESFDVAIAGYTYTGQYWVSPSAYILGEPKTDRSFPVVFGYDSTASRPLVYIGDPSAEWSYLEVTVSQVYGAVNPQAWKSGWNITTTTGSYERGNTSAASDRTAVQIGRDIPFTEETGSASTHYFPFIDSSGTSVKNLKIHSGLQYTPSTQLVKSIGAFYGDDRAVFTEFRIRNNENNRLSVAGSSFRLNSTGNIHFTTTNSFTSRMFIDGTTGDVGINTTTPNSYSTGATKLVISDTSGDTGMTIHSNPANKGLIYFADGTGTGVVSRQGQVVYDHSTNKMSFATSGSERVWIDDGGNLGIGITSPASPLVVQTNGANLDVANMPNAALHIDSISSTSIATIAARQTATGNGGLAFFAATHDSNANTWGDMYFNARENDNTDFATQSGKTAFSFVRYTSPLMKIMRDGKVGILSDNPQYTLSVTGTLGVSGLSKLFDNLEVYDGSFAGSSTPRVQLGDTTTYFQVPYGSNAQISSYHGIDFITQKTSATTVMSIDGTNHRVGIGTTSPGQLLDVRTTTPVAGQGARLGEAKVGTWYGTDYAEFSHYINSNSLTNYALIQRSNGSTTLNAKSGQSISFSISNAAKMVVNSAGNIGIGTTSPTAAKLQVAGNFVATSGFTTFTGDGLFGATAVPSYISLPNGSKLIFGYRSTGNGLYYGRAASWINSDNKVTWGGASSPNEFSIETSGSERLRIDEYGNVGIGTTTPDYKLDVDGDLRVTGSAYITGSLNFSSSPTSIINMGGGGSYITSFGNSLTELRDYLLRFNSSGGASIENRASQAGGTLTIKTNNSQSLLLQPSAGNVGIRTTTPNYTLSVTGTLGVSGNAVMSTITASNVLVDTITAREFHTQLVTASVIYESGSTKFGDTQDDLHQFTGSVDITGSARTSNLIISPDSGSTVQPQIQFIGSSSNPITLKVLDDNSLSFRNSSNNEVFHIDADLTGTIFSVTDGSGIPSIEVEDTGDITLAEFGGNVGVGTGSPAYKLDVSGTMRVTGASQFASVSGTLAQFNSLTVLNGSTSLASISGTIGEFTVVTASVFTGSTGLLTSLTASNAYISGNVGIGTNQTTNNLTVSGGVDITGSLDVTGNTILNTVSASQYYVDSTSTAHDSGPAIQRHFNKFVYPGYLQEFAYFHDIEGTVAFEIQVSSETGAHSGTSLYRFQGGFSQLSAGYYYRLMPCHEGRGHGNGEDDGISNTAWHLYMYRANNSSYTYGVAVYVPSGVAGKNIRMTITELKRGMTFTDQSSNSEIASFSTSSKIYSSDKLIADKIVLGNGSNTSPTITFYDDLNTGIYRPAADELGFTTAGSERVRIDNNGLVGIGETNPTHKLNVVGEVGIGATADTSTNYMLDIASTKGGSTQAAIRVRYPAGGGLANTEMSSLAYKNVGWRALYAKQGAGSSAIYADGTSHFTGSVEVTGTLDITGSARTSNLIISPDAGSTVQPKITYIGSSSNPIELKVLDDNTLSWEGSAGQLFSIANNLTGGVIFSVGDVSGIPLLEAEASGTVSMARYGTQVGIGTNQTTDTLTVSGGVDVTGSLSIDGFSTSWGTTLGIENQGINVRLGTGANATWLLHGTSAGTFRGGIQQLDGGNGARWYTNGTSQNAYLYSGGLQLSTGDFSSTSGRIKIGNGTEAAPAFSFWGDTNTGMYLPAADELGFSTNGVERLTIDNNGLVGIGTNPTHRLTVFGDVSIGGTAYTSTNYMLDIASAKGSANFGAVRIKAPTVGGSLTNTEAHMLSDIGGWRAIYAKQGSAASAIYADGTSHFTGSVEVTGNVDISGTLTATAKSFDIEHPTKEGMRLVYGSLESPYHGVRLTGESCLTKGESKVFLPDYIYSLCKQEGSTVQVTNIKHGKVLWVEEINIEKNYFIIKADIEEDDNRLYSFFWSFTAIRKDIEDLVVEKKI